MIEDIVFEPMTQDFVLWRCLHSGPLTASTIDRWAPEDKMPWARYRERNHPLLSKLTEAYGACVIAAKVGDEVVGQLRFYPKAVWEMDGAGMLCLQQDHPAGPVDNFAETRFPPLEELDDKTLTVHCLMAGAPEDERYKRSGIATQMVKTLIHWARENDWGAIQANAFEDIPIIYQWTGNAGHTFWKKLGFHIIERFPDPDFSAHKDFMGKIEAQAKASGIDPERAKDRIVMRLELL